MAARYLVDTNVLLRLSNPSSTQHRICETAVVKLNGDGALLHYTLQNASKFWNACTRPVSRNGHGLAASQADVLWSDIEVFMSLLPDDERVYRMWRALVKTHQVQGVQVHDAKLAAAMLAHEVPHILTFNTSDFDRYSGIEAVHPEEVPHHAH